MITPRFKRLSASTTLSLPVTAGAAFSPLSAGEALQMVKLPRLPTLFIAFILHGGKHIRII